MTVAAEIDALVRPNILSLQPYTCARHEYSNSAEDTDPIYLDANENAHGAPSLHDMDPTHWHEMDLHRYPDPLHLDLKRSIGAFRNVDASMIFTGSGSDEAIDLLMRIFCRPQIDKIVTTPPSYGMYKVSASINDLQVIPVPLNGDFQLDIDRMAETLKTIDNIKILFLCSPGNPTGIALTLDSIRSILSIFHGIVVIDEAYVDFSNVPSCVSLLGEYSNLVILQTFSKSFGMAGARLGIALAHPRIIHWMNCTKPPYNVSTPTAELGMEALRPENLKKWKISIDKLKSQRDILVDAFRQSAMRTTVRGGFDANFLLVQLEKLPGADTAWKVYQGLLAEHVPIVVRYRGQEVGCENCLRVTVGTEEENKLLLAAWSRVVHLIYGQ